jgi:flagellar protein FliO/FliZ
MNGDGIFLQGLFFLMAFGCVLFLAYVVTRYVAGKSKALTKGKYMSIIETIGLGQDKRLYLVKVGNRHLLISAAGKTVDCLAEFEIEENENDGKDNKHEYDDNEAEDEFTFKSMIKRFTNSRSGKQPFHNNLDKLKRMNGALEDKTTEKDGVEYTDE